MRTTLEVHGIRWNARKHEGKLALSYQSIAIFFNSENNRFEAWSLGSMICSDETIVYCLETATIWILESSTAHYSPVWETDTRDTIPDMPVRYFEAA